MVCIVLTGLMMRLGVVGTCTRDQGEELIEKWQQHRQVTVHTNLTRTAETKRKELQLQPHSRRVSATEEFLRGQDLGTLHRLLEAPTQSFWGNANMPVLLGHCCCTAKMTTGWPNILHSESSLPAIMCVERTQIIPLWSIDIIHIYTFERNEER